MIGRIRTTLRVCSLFVGPALGPFIVEMPALGLSVCAAYLWFVGCVDDLYRRTRCRGSP